ncbi:MAG TPA: gfo/Idh/MocA family oxidoreductase [Bacteroidales bacterium]|nr:gfo/Idh/MocA family oxidoreductase [Bacteroidales bacterium]HBH82570.1 gfo/Idh/MocA family oxidoreductase [Bacteroidales bacterium]
MNIEHIKQLSSRRKFIKLTSLGAAAIGLQQVGCKGGGKPAPAIEGLENVPEKQDAIKPWVPVSDRKIRVGLIGYGVCKFSAAFGFQDHPNVEVAAVSDLFPDRCAELAKVARCKKTYPSLEELVKDDSIEAVMISTDAPGHARHAIEALKHGKHVAINVPAVFGSLEEADRLLEAVKKSGLKYMMFETSCFHDDLYAMRQIYNAGGFGKLVYSEGEYWHYSEKGIDSYKGWRHGMPPQWYPTHSNAYYIGVTDGSFTEVSCLGMPSQMERYQKGQNRYNNPFATEIALFRTNEGGMARMSRSSDTPGFGGEIGRIRGQKGTYYGKYEGLEKVLPDLNRPPLPPGIEAGGHGGSHGRLMDEFVTAILQDRKPLIDVAVSLNMTVSGIVAHDSAMRGGEWMKIPQYKL